jgi:hypothetical protein
MGLGLNFGVVLTGQIERKLVNIGRNDLVNRSRTFLSAERVIVLNRVALGRRFFERGSGGLGRI